MTPVCPTASVPHQTASGRVYPANVRRGTVVEVVEVGEVTIAEVVDRPDELPAVADESNEREEVVVVRA